MTGISTAAEMALVRSYSKLVKALDAPVTLSARRPYLGPHAHLGFKGRLDTTKDKITLVKTSKETNQLELVLVPKVAGKPILIDVCVQAVWANTKVEASVAGGGPVAALTLPNVSDSRGHLNFVFTPTSKAKQIVMVRPGGEGGEVNVLSIQVTPTL